jgi:hypothetical protein
MKDEPDMRFVIEERHVGIREFARTQSARLRSSWITNLVTALTVALERLDPTLAVSWLNLRDENRNEDVFQVNVHCSSSSTSPDEILHVKFVRHKIYCIKYVHHQKTVRSSDKSRKSGLWSVTRSISSNVEFWFMRSYFKKFTE